MIAFLFKDVRSHSPKSFIVSFASRFLLNYFVSEPSGSSLEMEFMRDRIDLIRRVLFSRILRLLPLSHQVGTVEGLATVVKLFPYLFPLTDQHVLTFLSELLKMASVADKEMSDEKLKEIVVDKDGYVPLETGSDRALYPRQSSALFYRRECVLTCGNMRVVILPELPVGIQFRVSTILLLHAIIKNNSDLFFDADPTTPIGKIILICNQAGTLVLTCFANVFREYTSACCQPSFPVSCVNSVESGQCCPLCTARRFGT